MGVHPNISATKFPRQGPWVGKRTRVCFNYDTRISIMGSVIRDDAEDPFKTIILLDDGRVVLTSECQHTQPE